MQAMTIQPADQPTHVLQTPTRMIHCNHFDAPTRHGSKQLHNPSESRLPHRYRKEGIREVLDQPEIMTLVGKIVAARMTKCMRMDTSQGGALSGETNKVADSLASDINPGRHTGSGAGRSR